MKKWSLLLIVSTVLFYIGFRKNSRKTPGSATYASDMYKMSFKEGTATFECTKCPGEKLALIRIKGPCTPMACPPRRPEIAIRFAQDSPHTLIVSDPSDTKFKELEYTVYTMNKSLKDIQSSGTSIRMGAI